MGILGRYLDSLPVRARDRLIAAQDWCVAGVIGPGDARCLVGHAENWRPWADPAALHSSAADPEARSRHGDPVALLCRPALFAFRCARPADLAAYRRRLRRWGVDSEGRIGGHFDRLCVRVGVVGAVRLVKARAARDFRPDALLAPRRRARATTAT